MSLSLKKLNEQGFIFQHYDQKLIDFNDLEASALRLKPIISQLLSVDGESLFYDIDTIKPQMELKPHYHVIPGSFQVVIWIPEEPFIGRDFLFGTTKQLQRYHPELGYMCFMKPNDPNFLHGVSRLESNKPIRSIGFSSQVSKVRGNQDIFVETDNIANDLCDIKRLLTSNN